MEYDGYDIVKFSAYNYLLFSIFYKGNSIKNVVDKSVSVSNVIKPPALFIFFLIISIPISLNN